MLIALVFHLGYDEAEVWDYGFLVRLQYASALSIVISSHGKNLSRKMILIIAYHFSNEGSLLYCGLCGYIEEFLTHYFVCDALFFYLSHIDA